MTLAMDPLALVERRLAEVSTSLQVATGGVALCRIDGSHGSVKDLEGRTAALLEARRLLRGTPARDLAPVLDQWQESRDARRARAASEAWRAYDDGGVAELERLVGQRSADSEGGADR